MQLQVPVMLAWPTPFFWHKTTTSLLLTLFPRRSKKSTIAFSPLVDKEIEEYLADHDLDLTATTDGATAYRDADYVIVSTPTNYDPEKNPL